MLRNLHLSLIPGIALVISAILVTDSPSQADEEVAIPEATNSSDYFDDKIVGIAVKGVSADKSNTWLTDVELIDIEGRTFLVGHSFQPSAPGSESDLVRGVICGYAWDDVALFRALTKKQFDEQFSKWKKQKETESDSDAEKY